MGGVKWCVFWICKTSYHEKLRSLPADHYLTGERSNASFLTRSTTCSQILGSKKRPVYVQWWFLRQSSTSCQWNKTVSTESSRHAICHMQYTCNLKITLGFSCVVVMHSSGKTHTVKRRTTQWSNQAIIHVCWFLKPAALEDHGSLLPAAMHHFVSLRSLSAPWRMWYDFPGVVELVRISDVVVLLTCYIHTNRTYFGRKTYRHAFWRIQRSNCPRLTPAISLRKKRCLAVQFSYVQHTETIRLCIYRLFPGPQTQTTQAGHWQL